MTMHHAFTTLAEIAALTPEEFGRMLPDFVIWHRYASAAHIAAETVSQGFTWIDDGRPGELHSVSLNDVTVIKGPAFTGDEP